MYNMAGDIAAGTTAGIVAHHATKITDPGNTDEEIIRLLCEIRDALSPREASSINFPMKLQGYPYEYIVPDDLMNRPHFCIFLFDSTPVRFDGVFGGSYQKTVGPGWFQVDLPGRLSTSDGSVHAVIMSYRQEELGSAL